MPFSFGLPELIIVLFVIVLFFGAGRISRIAGEVGSGIRQFRQGLGGAKSADKKKKDEA